MIPPLSTRRIYHANHYATSLVGTEESNCSILLHPSTRSHAPRTRWIDSASSPLRSEARPCPGRRSSRRIGAEIAAADFFTVEVLTAGGLVRYFVMFVIRKRCGDPIP